MSNEPIEPIEQNYVPYQELFPETVRNGVEVKDNITDSNNTWSSEKIEDRLDEVTSSLTQALTDGLGTKQSISEKNEADGYLGLDENKKVLSNKFLIPKKKLAFLSDISLSAPYSSSFLSNVSGGGSFANTYNAKIKSGNSTFITAPTLTLSGSATGYVNLFVNREIMNIYAPFKIFLEIKLASLKNSIKQNRLTIGLSAYYASGNWQSSNGLVFSIDPTVNSGNFQYGKVLSGTATLINTAITISAETLTSFIIEYDKSTEEANFYIDYQLIGTITGVNIPNNTNIRETISFYSGDATETVIRRVSVFSNNIEFDLEG